MNDPSIQPEEPTLLYPRQPTRFGYAACCHCTHKNHETSVYCTYCGHDIRESRETCLCQRCLHEPGGGTGWIPPRF